MVKLTLSKNMLEIPIPKKSDTRICDICKETFDSQFISSYETLTHNKKVIHVCEECKDDEDYDDGEEMNCIWKGDSIYYPSYLL